MHTIVEIEDDCMHLSLTVLLLSIPQVFHFPLDVPANGNPEECRDGFHHLRVHQSLHQHQHHPIHFYFILLGTDCIAQCGGLHTFLYPNAVVIIRASINPNIGN